jgi:hypothetical protein
MLLVVLSVGWLYYWSLLGCPKIQMNPRTLVEEKSKRFSTQMTQEETKNLLKTAQTSKVVNVFTRALVPPFTWRRRDFYIPKTPSDPRNIPNVNMYMNVFYISHIYKPATSSHIKPGLFETATLTWPPTDSWISPFRKSPYAVTSELELQQIPELRRFPISWFRRLMTSGLHRFTTSGASQVQDSRSSQVRDFELRRSRASDLHKFATSELHRFKIPENSFHKFRKTRRFEGDMFSWIPRYSYILQWVENFRSLHVRKKTWDHTAATSIVINSVRKCLPPQFLALAVRVLIIWRGRWWVRRTIKRDKQYWLNTPFFFCIHDMATISAQ